MGMCFVLECVKGFLETLMALVLLQSIDIGSLFVTWISYRVYFIHNIWVQHVAAAMYSTSVLDKEMEDYFLLK